VTNVITLAPQLLERDVPPLLAEVLAAADRAAGYLDGPEYRAARRGDGLQCVADAVVSMRLTTRLLFMSSICMLARAWLTGQRDGVGILKMLGRTAFMRRSSVARNTGRGGGWLTAHRSSRPTTG
jgi:hypothetical protein